MDLPTAPRCLRLMRPAAALVCSAILYAAFLWPSTRYLADGIPYTAYNAETADARMLVPGDPLQLLYHFQLVRDMFAGRVPAFTNLYEFNLGDDAARRAFDPGYVPFSLLFAAASPIFGDAGAWNFTLFASVFTGFLLLLALARRFLGDEPSEIAVFVAAFVATCAPYRWVTLAGGSPTGFGMALIPAVALGVDMAVRDGRVRGGALAGVALVLCYATDLHSFLFATLALPLWCLVSWASASESPLPDHRRLLVLVKALLPLAAGVAVAGGIALLLRAQYAVTDAGGGRSLADIKLHSPVWQAIFDPSYPCHMAQHVNLGEGLPVAMVACGVLALGLAVFLLRRRRFRAPRLVGDVVCALLLAAAIVAALALALGTNGPLDALPLRALRKLVPPFALVRQPVKVFCLLPTFLAPFLVLSFGLARPFVSRRGLLEAAALISAALILVSSRAGMSAGTCLLPAAPNRAYAAAVTAAEAQGRTARALVLPVWPGDSAWSSLYQHHAIGAGLRMLNGYSPVKTADYLDTVFRRFEPATQGIVDDAQLAALRGFGATAVILHEDAFPEKVSPFPVGATLRRLLAHPRLRLLEQDRATWCFEILDAPRAAAASAVAIEPSYFAPARWWHFEQPDGTEGVVPASLPGSELSANVWTPAEPPEAYVWLVRAKGGDLAMRAGPRRVFPESGGVTNLVVGADWTWIPIPVGLCGSDRRTWLLAAGEALVSDAIFAQAPLRLPEWGADGAIRLDVVDFFHAGHTVRGEGGAWEGVRFDPLYDPRAEIAYGPNLPLAGGPARLSVHAEGEWEGEDASTWRVLLGGREVAVAEVGETVAFDYDGSSVLTIRFRYEGRNPVTLRAFTLRREQL